MESCCDSCHGNQRPAFVRNIKLRGCGTGVTMTVMLSSFYPSFEKWVDFLHLRENKQLVIDQLRLEFELEFGSRRCVLLSGSNP